MDYSGGICVRDNVVDDNGSLANSVAKDCLIRNLTMEEGVI